MCPSEKRCSSYSRVKRKSLLFAQPWEHLNYFLFFFVCIIKAGLGWPSSNNCSQSLQWLHIAGAMFTRAAEPSCSQNRLGGLGTGGTACAHPAQHPHRAPLPAPVKSQAIHLTSSAPLGTSYKYLPIGLSSQKCPLNYFYSSAERIIYNAPHQQSFRERCSKRNVKALLKERNAFPS